MIFNPIYLEEVKKPKIKFGDSVTLPAHNACVNCISLYISCFAFYSIKYSIFLITYANCALKITYFTRT